MPLTEVPITFSTRFRIVVSTLLVLLYVPLVFLIHALGASGSASAAIATVPAIAWVSGLVVRESWIATGQQQEG